MSLKMMGAISGMLLLTLLCAMNAIQRLEIKDLKLQLKDQQLTINTLHINVEGCETSLDNQTRALKQLVIDTDAVIAGYQKRLITQEDKIVVIRERAMDNATCENKLALVAEQQQDLFLLLKVGTSSAIKP